MDEMKPLGSVIGGAREAVPRLSQISTEPKPTSKASENRARVPLSRIGDSFDTFQVGPDTRDAYNAARAVAEGRAWCAFLYGRAGTGKTHLASAACHGKPYLFWKVPVWLQFLRKVIAGEEFPYDPEKVLRAHSKGDFLLVLDDYGAHNQTDWAEEQLYRLIDARYEQQAPTIVTSNAPMDRLDERVTSRLRSGFAVCDGPDWRAK